MDDDETFSSEDEDASVIKNFDDEAKLIVQDGTLPKKSGDRYLLVYNTYKKWKQDNKNFLSASEENNLLVR